MAGKEKRTEGEHMLQATEVINDALELKDNCSFVASKLMNAESLLYIGRGLDYALSMEGSLKLKEISYIHSESYAAGELKHGTISLITDGMPVIAVATQSSLVEKTISNIKEVKARGAAKRFKKTGTGELKRNKAYKSHILTKKTTKRKRNLRKATMTDSTNSKVMKKILPYL